MLVLYVLNHYIDLIKYLWVVVFHLFLHRGLPYGSERSKPRHFVMYPSCSNENNTNCYVSV